MAHTKNTRRAHSYYFEQQNPGAKRYIVTCALCQHQGFSPRVLDEGFANTVEKKHILSALRATYKPLHLNDFGRCITCAAESKE
jgi:hypothetical protein